MTINSVSLFFAGFHMTPKLHNIFPESCLLIVVGIIIGNITVIFCKKFYDVIQRRHLYKDDRPEIDIYLVETFSCFIQLLN